MDNLRTKAFWIGILAFPVMIAVVITVPIVFMKAKDVQRFAVIDQSGWLLPAVEERASVRDTNRVLHDIQDAEKSGAKALAALPGPLAQLAPTVKGRSEDELRSIARALVGEGKS